MKRNLEKISREPLNYGKDLNALDVIHTRAEQRIDVVMNKFINTPVLRRAFVSLADNWIPHLYMVAVHVDMLTDVMGTFFSENEKKVIRRAALLHDIAKNISIGSDVVRSNLSKLFFASSNKYNDDDFLVAKTHALKSGKIIDLFLETAKDKMSPEKYAMWKLVVSVIMGHHEVIRSENSKDIDERVIQKYLRNISRRILVAKAYKEADATTREVIEEKVMKIKKKHPEDAKSLLRTSGTDDVSLIGLLYEDEINQLRMVTALQMGDIWSTLYIAPRLHNGNIPMTYEKVLNLIDNRFSLSFIEQALSDEAHAIEREMGPSYDGFMQKRVKSVSSDVYASTKPIISTAATVYRNMPNLPRKNMKPIEIPIESITDSQESSLFSYILKQADIWTDVRMKSHSEKFLSAVTKVVASILAGDKKVTVQQSAIAVDKGKRRGNGTNSGTYSTTLEMYLQ